MKQTPGKGPFSASPANELGASVRWTAPRVELTPRNVADFLQFVERRCDTGVHKFFSSLATSTPAFRLARNLSEVLRQLAYGPVDDVLQSGLSAVENSALSAMERFGIPIELLSVAHALLNIPERRLAARHFSDLFEELRR